MKWLPIGGMMLAAAVVTFLGCATVKESDTALATDEVIELISGNTVYGTNTRGHHYIFYFAADGSLKNAAGDKGVWEVKDGSVCNTWKTRGFLGCDKVYRQTNGKKGKFREFKKGDHL